jgi:hypothetical protein
MARTTANRPTKPKPRRTPSQLWKSECVVAICERSDAGGMKRPPANQSMKLKPRHGPPLWRVIERMLLASAKVVTAMAKLIGAVTGFLMVLLLAGYIG